MEQLEEAIRLLRRRWWLIPLTAVVALVVVIALNLLATPRYRTRARYLVAPIALEDQGDLVDSTEGLRNASVTATFAELFNSPTLQQEAAAVSQIADGEAYEVNAVVLPETNVVQVTVNGPDPAKAQQLANNLGNEVVAYRQRVVGIYELHELDPAPLAETPYTPRIGRDAAIALVLGAVMGGVLALGLPYLLALIAPAPVGLEEEVAPAESPRWEAETEQGGARR